MIQGHRQAFFLDFLEKSAYGVGAALTKRYVIQDFAKC